MGTRDWYGQSGPVEKRKGGYEDESTAHVEVGKVNGLEAWIVVEGGSRSQVVLNGTQSKSGGFKGNLGG
jgi:hypothetical protein